MSNQPTVIATRGSKLALWQSEYVKALLKDQSVESELKIVKTKGDKVQDRFLHEIGGKGLFVKELEQNLLDGTADIAVHSLKDLPAKTPEPFRLQAILKRHSPRDILILHPECPARESLPEEIKESDTHLLEGLKIATASLRRQSLLKSIKAPGLQLFPVRGNVDTRIEKLMSGKWDGIILAEAAIQRLEIKGLHTRILHADWFVPAPAQGALAIECVEDHRITKTLDALNCAATQKAVQIERLILHKLGGDCTMPIGCFLTSENGRTTGKTKVLDYDGNFVYAESSWDQSITALDVENAAESVMKDLKEKNIDAILERLKEDPPDLGALD